MTVITGTPASARLRACGLPPDRAVGSGDKSSRNAGSSASCTKPKADGPRQRARPDPGLTRRLRRPGQSVNPEVLMLLHVLHAVAVVTIVLAFPCGMAGAVVLFDDGGSLGRSE